jgi:phosphatidylserine/phosphatidylglycerophosphate/cardiolipin synthase-like enzyme
MRAIGSARRSIWMTQLAFDANCQAYGPGGQERPVADALFAAVARGPIDVRVILNETLLLDTARPLRRFFAGRLGTPPRGPGTIAVRGVSSFPRLLHSKMVIVDGEAAFLLGSPFVNGYWDDERHEPVDARRPMRELGGRPLHDLSIRITGRPVADLERLFAELWVCRPFGSEAEAARRQPAASVEAAPSAKAPVRVVSTAPRGVLRNRPAIHRNPRRADRRARRPDR